MSQTDRASYDFRRQRRCHCRSWHDGIRWARHMRFAHRWDGRCPRNVQGHPRGRER